jgi:hypothetical protein
VDSNRVLKIEDYVGKLSTDLTSEEYHTFKGTFSSSQLKDMVDDPELFYKKYISREIEKEHVPAFDVGTYFHTAILEPEKLDLECAVYTEGIRSGKKWEAFKEANKGKAIITGNEKEVADLMIKATKDSPVAMKTLSTSKPEVSAFIVLYVLYGHIYTFRGGVCFYLGMDGWVEGSHDNDPEDIKEFGVEVVMKVRADALDETNATISDLKSTGHNAKKKHDIQSSISSYKYDLSAALYLDIFSMMPFGDKYVTFKKFIWIFASKKFGNAKSWQASKTNIRIGRAKWKYAVLEIARYKKSNWVFDDCLEVLEPQNFEHSWLAES